MKVNRLPVVGQGTAQIPALALKHVVLGTVTVLGLVGVVKLQRIHEGDRST